MKKIIIALLLFMLFSCEKEERYCYKCKREVFAPGGYYSVILQMCNVTEDEIRAFEDNNNKIEGGVTITMLCKREL